MEAKARNVLPRGDSDPPGAGSGTRVSHVCTHRQLRETGAGWAACVRMPQETRSRLRGELDYFEHLLLKGFPGQGNTRLTLDRQPPAARRWKAWPVQQALCRGAGQKLREGEGGPTHTGDQPDWGGGRHAHPSSRGTRSSTPKGNVPGCIF